MDSIKIKQISESLQECLDNKRYEHTVGVAECAVQLAQKFGADKEKAYLAGLLHDCAKCTPIDKLIQIMHENEKFLNIDKCEYLNPKTFHAPAGAIIARDKYNIKDLEILSAIRWHTLGKKDMTLLEKIVFLADKIEIRTRPLCYRETAQKLLEEEQGLDKAILECYRNTIKSLAERNLVICYTTIDIYNALLDKLY